MTGHTMMAQQEAERSTTPQGERTATAGAFDQARSDVFGERMLERMNAAAVLLMSSVGHPTGLFDTMDGMPAATPQQIAAAAGLGERYVREWLGAMLTGGVVEHDPEAGTYWLPVEHAAWLTRRAEPNNLAGVAQWLGVLGSVESDVVEAFKHGRGVPYERYPRFHEVMAEESQQTVVAALDDAILPMVPGLIERLEAGIDVLDIGCGAGRAVLHLARRFPRSRFIGYDLSGEAIDLARRDAEEAGLKNVGFMVRDLARMTDTDQFDLITSFDVIHDQAEPATVLENVRRALRPGGTFLMQDIACCSRHHDNLDHPIGPFVYTISCMHCMSVSLANGGPGLGAAWGKELALNMLADAGWEDVQVTQFDHDPMNYWYVGRKPRG